MKIDTLNELFDTGLQVRAEFEYKLLSEIYFTIKQPQAFRGNCAFLMLVHLHMTLNCSLLLWTMVLI